MRTVPMQADLFNAIANQRALPAVSRAEAVQLLASLLYEVQQTRNQSPPYRDGGQRRHR